MKKPFLLIMTVAAMLIGCQSGNKHTDEGQDNRLLFVTEIDEEEDDDVTIVTSPDGRICLYSRNNAAHDAVMGWSILYDVKVKDSVYTYEGLPDWTGEASSIIRIHCLPHPKRSLYLFDAYFRISGAYAYQSYITYELVGHELKRVNLWKDEDHLFDEMGFEYNIPDYYFRFARSLDYSYQYMWDEENGIFYYPLLEPGTYLLTDKFACYRWTGKCLQPTGDTVCNPRLYEPLRDYVACLQHTDCGYVQVRVDSMPDGRLRYTAWDRGISVRTEPNIILYGERVGNEFHFRNPPTYTYVVTIEDTPEVRLYHSTDPGQLGELYGTYKEE